jgi:hypothetical protein
VVFAALASSSLSPVYNAPAPQAAPQNTRKGCEPASKKPDSGLKLLKNQLQNLI